MLDTSVATEGLAGKDCNELLNFVIPAFIVIPTEDFSPSGGTCFSAVSSQLSAVSQILLAH
jgi:hypothetical protein